MSGLIARRSQRTAAEPTVTVLPDGRTVQPGAEVSVSGWAGRYRYTGWCHADGSLSVYGGPAGGEQFRAARAGSVRTVHRIARTRAGTT